MEWYNIIPNVNCIFAIDNNSTVNNDGNLLELNDGTLNYLRTENNAKDKIYKTITSDTLIRNYLKDYTQLYKYKSIRINKSNLIFNQSISLPPQFTFILKTKLYSTSLFLSKDFSVNNHGFCFDFNNGSSPYNLNWRFNDFRTGLNYTLAEKQNFKPAIDTLIIKGNLNTQSVTVITTYGTYTVPKDTNFTDTNRFLTGNNFNVLGYSLSTYYPDADIIAYGLFDKEFTQDEIDQVLTKIDEQFLIEKTDIKIEYTDTQDQAPFINSIIDVETNDQLKYYPYLKPLGIEPNQIINSKVYTKDILVKNYGTIFDYVYEENIPVQTILYLINRADGKLIDSTYSNIEGYFEFKNIDISKDYIVISPDKKYQFKSVIKDYIKDN